MPRNIDYRRVPMTQLNLISSFDRLFAELSYVAGYPAGSGDYPQWTGLHYGGDINNAIDRVDAMINSAAVLLGKAAPGNGSRVEDFRTGTHDVARLHAELDRLHKRIEAIAGRSVVDKIHPSRPFILARTGPATYITPSGALKTAGDGVARIGLPWVVRRNLFNNSIFNGTAGWGTTNSAILSVAPSSSLPAGYPSSIGEGKANAVKMTIAGGAFAGNLAVDVALKAGETITLSGIVYIPSSVVSGAWGVKIANAGYSAVVEAPIIERDQWVEKVVTYTAPSDGTYRLWFGSTGSSTAGQYIFVAEPQWSRSPGKLPYQPTNATGPDLTHPLNGAGLVLEGAGTNLCLQSQNLATSPWVNNGSPTSTANYAAAPDGTTTATRLQFAAGGYHDRRQTIALTSGAVYTASIWVKATTGTQAARFMLFDNAGNAIASLNITATSEWQRVHITSSAASVSGNGSLRVGSAFGNPETDILVWGAQLEQSPFPTSYIPTTTAAATRQPDRVGIVPPHNLLKWSERFDNAVWQKFNGTISATGVAGPEGLADAFTFNATSTGSPHLRQALALQAGKTYCPAIWVRRNSGTGDIVADLGDGAAITRTLSTSWQRLEFPTTKGAQSWLDFRFTATGTYDICRASLVDGSHPGIYVPTTDTPIPAPVSPALDPAWSQNGRLRFRVLPPPISTGKHVAYLGMFDGVSNTYQDATFCLARASSQGLTGYQLIFERKHSGGSQTRGALFVNVPAFWDGAPHDLELEWTNEIRESDGVRQMWQRLYVDGVLVAQQDVAALYGATAWAPIDPSRLISDGNCFAVLSRISLDYPTPRAGYRQVA